MPRVERGEYPARGICQTQPPLLAPAAKQIEVINLGLHPLQPDSAKFHRDAHWRWEQH